MKTTTEQMDASQVFCPNLDCVARGQVGQGNIVSHGKARPRYRCKTCGKTFSAQAGTMFEGLRKPKALIVIVVTLLAYGCPIQAIVQAFGLDERTVASWRDRAGKQCQQVQQALVQQGHLDLVQVQADEVRVEGHQMIAWMGLAMMVSTRLWLGGVVSLTRDRNLADRLLAQVRSCCQPLRALLVCTDGWNAYPGSIRRAFRQKVKETAGRGRACLRGWPQVCIAVVIKRTQKKCVVEITRKMVQGTLEQAQVLLAASGGGTVLNTAFIERLNGTIRQRLASLTRKCRHAARHPAAPSAFTSSSERRFMLNHQLMESYRKHHFAERFHRYLNFCALLPLFSLHTSRFERSHVPCHRFRKHRYRNPAQPWVKRQ